MYSVKEVMDNEFLEARSMLIEIAAILDRHDRARQQQSNGKPANADERVAVLNEAIQLLGNPNEDANRAEQLLLHFTDAMLL